MTAGVDRHGNDVCGRNGCAVCARLRRATRTEQQLFERWQASCQERRDAMSAWVEHLDEIAKRAA